MPPYTATALFSLSKYKPVGYWHQRADERHGNHLPRYQELLVVKDKAKRSQVSLGWASPWNVILFSLVLRHYWSGNRKGIRPVKHWVLVRWWWHFDWSFARLIAPVVTTTSIILSSNKPVNSGSSGKWPLKWRWGDWVSRYKDQQENAWATNLSLES